MSGRLWTLALLALLCGTPMVFAQEFTAQQLVDALAPPPKTRAVIVGSTPPPAQPSVSLQVQFEYDSADLTPSARVSLDSVSTALNDPRLQQFSFNIVGHTDTRGEAGYNLKLSEERAAAVRNYLVTAGHILPQRLNAEGKGEADLLFPQAPESADNRRVQILTVVN